MEKLIQKSVTFNDYVKIKEEELNNLLYHYTSLDSFSKITESNKMLASDYRYLNDRKEIDDILDHLSDSIKEHLERNMSPHIFNEMFKVDRFSRRFFPYIISFTQNEDQLSQWRGYCKNGGLSIGLNYNYLKQFESTRTNFFLGPCVYDSNLKVQIIDELLANSEGNVDTFYNDFFYISPFFKNESFIEEQEWRLVIIASDRKMDKTEILTRDTDIRFIPKNNKIIPYLSIPIELSKGLYSICLSPLTEYNENEYAIKEFLRINNLKSVQIKSSKCPFRN